MIAGKCATQQWRPHPWVQEAQLLSRSHSAPYLSWVVAHQASRAVARSPPQTSFPKTGTKTSWLHVLSDLAADTRRRKAGITVPILLTGRPKP